MTNIDFELARDRQATLRREADANRLARRARRRARSRDAS
jgi:hypothetical protein